MTWGYICWHLIVHGPFVISDSWWRNNAALDRPRVTELLRGGGGIVASREGTAVPGVPDDALIAWHLEQVGEGFSRMVDRILAAPEIYLRLLKDEHYRPGHLAAFDVVKDRAREAALRRVGEGAGPRWLRQDFYSWLDPGASAQVCAAGGVLGGFLDHPYRQNFQLWLRQAYGHDAVLVRRNQDVTQWLSGGADFLVAANRERTTANTKVEVIDWTDWAVDEKSLWARWFLYMRGPDLARLGQFVRDPGVLLGIVHSKQAKEWHDRRVGEFETTLEYRRLAGNYFSEVVARLSRADASAAGLLAQRSEALRTASRPASVIAVLLAAGVTAATGLEGGVAVAAGGGGVILASIFAKFSALSAEVETQRNAAVADVMDLLKGERDNVAGRQGGQFDITRTSLGPSLDAKR